jgi:hypothetical protein
MMSNDLPTPRRFTVLSYKSSHVAVDAKRQLAARNDSISLSCAKATAPKFRIDSEISEVAE